MGYCERKSAECYIECRNYNNGTPDPNPDQCGIIVPDTPDIEPPPCPASVENDCESLIDNLGPEWDTCKSDTDSVTEIKEVCKLEACLWIGETDETEMIQQVHKGKDGQLHGHSVDKLYPLEANRILENQKRHKLEFLKILEKIHLTHLLAVVKNEIVVLMFAH